VLDSRPRDFFLDEAGLKATRLAQLPICPWCECRHDASARCATCPADFQLLLFDQHHSPDGVISR
jgi:hypothetical protein